MIMNSRPASPSFVSTFPAFTLMGVTRRDTACSSFFVHSLKRGILASVLSIDARAIVTPGSSDGISQHTPRSRVKTVSSNLGCLRRAPRRCSTIRRRFRRGGSWRTPTRLGSGKSPRPTRATSRSSIPTISVMTYGELYALTNQIVHGLRALGLQAGRSGHHRVAQQLRTGGVGARRVPGRLLLHAGQLASRRPRDRVHRQRQRDQGLHRQRPLRRAKPCACWPSPTCPRPIDSPSARSRDSGRSPS